MALLTPRARGESVWAYGSSFGGGLVAGDETALHLRIDRSARCFFGTQASSKVYRNPEGRRCSHRLEAEVAAEGLLVLAPDPVQCFAESSYTQTQTFQLAADANLVVVDWLSSGRSARGERWAFRQYESRNRVFREGRWLLLDAMRLDRESGPISQPFRGGRFNCLGTVFLFGPMIQPGARAILEKIGDQSALGEVGEAGLVFSASPVAEGAVIRFAASGVERAGRAIGEWLQFVPGLLAGDPWRRKW